MTGTRPILKSVRVRSFDPEDLLEYIEWAGHVVEFHCLGGLQWIDVRKGSDPVYSSVRVKSTEEGGAP